MKNKTIKCYDVISKLCTYLIGQNKQPNFVLLYDGFGVVEGDTDILLDLITDISKDIYFKDGDIDLAIVEKEEWDDDLLAELCGEWQANATVIQLKDDNRQVIFIEYEH